MNPTSLLNGVVPPSEKNGEWKIISPAEPDQVLGVCAYRYSDVEFALRHVRPDAIPSSFELRLDSIRRARNILRQEKASLLKVALSELGRTRSDLESEWHALEDYFERLLETAAHSLDGTTPRGVSVILGSYVWPIFYSAQFLFANFLVGNSVILKPAEKATLTVWRLVEILRALEPFSGTQLVVGDREVGRRLAIHEAVSTVIFQGSFEVGMRVKQDCLSQPAKEVLLYLGSKNASIVFADANALAVDRLIEDCFQGAGQNCRSISVIFVERSKLPEFCEKFHEKSKAFKIGNPNADAWMGPLVEGAICDRYLKFIGISEREGAELLMRGKLLPQAGRGYFVTPTLAVFKEITSDKFRKSVSLQTEVLSPHVSIIGFETEDALLALVDQMTYGRLATIWTEDSERSKRIAARLSVGEIAINQGALQMHPWDTTQARKRSGNHAYLGRGLLSQLVYQKQVYGE